MRIKNVEIAGKKIVVTEKTIGELKQLAKEINIEFDSFIKTDTEGKMTADIVDTAMGMLEDKVTQIFPQLTSEDIDNSYPSELEELIGGFVEVNFSSLKKVFSKVMNMM